MEETVLSSEKKITESTIKNKKKYIIVFISVLIAASVITALLLYNFKINKSIDYYVCYQKDGGIFVHRTDTKKAIKFADQLLSDGDYINLYGFLPKDKNDFIYSIYKNSKPTVIYYRSISNDSVSDAQIIEENAYSVQEAYNSRIFYKTKDKTLYMLESTQPKKIADNVESFYTGNVGDKIIFTTNDKKLYQMKTDSSPVYVDDQINEFRWSSDLNYLCYTKNKTLYYKSFGEEKKEICKGDISIYKLEKNGNLYYSLLPDISLYDFVNDNCAGNGDKAVEELRNKLKEIKHDYYYVNLYKYNGNDSKLIDKYIDGIIDYHNHIIYPENHTIYTYWSYNIDNFSKPNIDTIKSTDDIVKVLDNFTANVENHKCNLIIDDKKYTLNNQPFIISLDCKYAYYYKNQNSGNKKQLFQCKIDNPVNTEKLIDSDVANIGPLFEMNLFEFNNELYYCKNYDTYLADLYKNGEKQQSKVNIAYLSHLYENNNYLLCDSENEVGTLKVLRKNGFTDVAQNVSKFINIGNDSVVYQKISDTAQNSKSIYIYRDGVSTEIDHFTGRLYDAIPINN